MTKHLFLSNLCPRFFAFAERISPAAVAQDYMQGKWSTLQTLMPINPVHLVLLSNGKVLVVAGSSARLAQGMKDTPVDAAIVGVIDTVDVTL